MCMIRFYSKLDAVGESCIICYIGAKLTLFSLISAFQYYIYVKIT